MHLQRFKYFLVILVLLAGVSVALSSSARAAGTASITGNIVAANTNAAVQSATVDLVDSSGGVVAKTTSGKDGSFAFTDLSAGNYYLRVTAKLYQPTESGVLPLADGANISLTVALQPVNVTSITTLGHVTVKGHPVLNTSSAPTVTISSSAYVAKGLPQIQDLLATTPGITIEHFDNGAPGNVATLTIRGAGGFVGGSNTGYEVLVLQDGEPLRNGQFGDFDLSTLTPAIYSNVEVVKGVGGTSLFGANTIGGTVNLVTRDPQATAGGELIYGVGGYGTDDFNLSGTSTFGRVGMLFDVHQYDTLGYIPSNFIGDYNAFSAGQVGYLTNPTLYFKLRSGLAKVKYSFSNNTNVVVTVSDESDIRDQTGLLTNPSPVCFTGAPDCNVDPLGNQYMFGFPGNYLWNIQPKYSVDINTVLGGGSLVLRAYHQWLLRLVDGENAATPPFSCCFIQTQADRLTGEEALWTKSLGLDNTLTLAVGGNGDYFNYGSLSGSVFQPSTNIFFSPQNCKNLGWCEATQIERTYLVRDDAAVTPKLDITFAGYFSDYDTLNVKRFDPRLAIVDKASPNTVFRASIGTGFAAPRISDLQPYLNTSHFSAGSFAGCPASEPFCTASTGNPNLKSETATGYDLGWEQLFGQNGDISLDLYRTDLKNHIFDGFEPAPPGTPTFDNGKPILFLNLPINLAGTTYSGLETTAALPVGQYFSVNPYYDIQGAYPTDVPLSVQQAIGDVVDNQQYLGVPLHKLGWSLNYHSLSRLTTASIGADWIGTNNSYNANPFWVYNATATLPVGPASVHIGWTNIFNTQAGLFSIFGGGVPYGGAPGCYLSGNGPCNAQGQYVTSMYNRAPHMLTITLDEKWGSLR